MTLHIAPQYRRGDSSNSIGIQSDDELEKDDRMFANTIKRTVADQPTPASALKTTAGQLPEPQDPRLMTSHDIANLILSNGMSSHHEGVMLLSDIKRQLNWRIPAKCVSSDQMPERDWHSTNVSFSLGFPRMRNHEMTGSGVYSQWPPPAICLGFKNSPP